MLNKRNVNFFTYLYVFFLNYYVIFNVTVNLEFN